MAAKHESNKRAVLEGIVAGSVAIGQCLREPLSKRGLLSALPVEAVRPKPSNRASAKALWRGFSSGGIYDLQKLFHAAIIAHYLRFAVLKMLTYNNRVNRAITS